ncbi:DUF4355 domain-containing protein [Leuconostoc falkenbergense]|uniref:DUF4355 domain-containing protein n=1 Tax=Leuconostoc falkenbergense TaxID=2766470 RepID=UPI0024AC882D|nr:DUF4355 domain-containing protein [Leuconostoc falkenbergense]MDI6667060.1 DUF4355 domain-containing protein [Leuconostoc falkenbergense]
MADEVNTEETNTGTETTDNQEQTETQDDKLTFTPKEFDSEVDKRIANALQTAKAKWDEEKKEEISNAEKLAKMSASDRKAAEDKAKQEALDNREKQLNMREYRYEAKHQLEENGLPDSFVDMVLSEDAETTKNNIGAIKAEFDKAIEAAVNERLKGKTPQSGGTAGKLNKKLSDMSLEEMTEAYRNNTNLFG